jgi:hypothetical protein
MIDPVSIGLAVAGAKQAVSFIKEAINVGHDIASMGKELGKFFTAQGEVEAAAKEAESIRKDPKKSGDKSATEIAMDCVLRAEELRVAERELRDMFALQGKMDMYNRMCKIRSEIISSREKILRDERRKQEREIENKKKLIRQIKETILALFFANIIMVTYIGLIWLVVLTVSSWHKWKFCMGIIICIKGLDY